MSVTIKQESRQAVPQLLFIKLIRRGEKNMSAETI